MLKPNKTKDLTILGGVTTISQMRWRMTETMVNEEAVNGRKRSAVKVPAATAVIIPELDTATINVWIRGTSELIENKWATKAVRQMIDKQIGEASQGKEPKNPDENFLESLYILKMGKIVGKFADGERSDDGHPNVRIEGGRFGFPSVGFKAAMVDACTSLKKSITKVQARQSFHVLGELTEIFGTPRMRQDMVRLNGQTADIRFRGAFPEWAAKLQINYNRRALSVSQLTNLLNVAGYAVGVGEFRPSKNGPYGRFEVCASEKEAKANLK